jgi:UDP:flavonoid glycosyltransferase YjiC (YdhE family)
MGYSHLEYTGSLADALIDAGHEVVSYFLKKYLIVILTFRITLYKFGISK